MSCGRLIVAILILLSTYIFDLFFDYNYTNYITGGSKPDQSSDEVMKALKYIDNAVAHPKPTLFFEELSYKYKYNNYGIFVQNCHIGQRKLLLNEIQFLTYATKPQQQHIIIYVGAAPCEHLTIIQTLFPGNKYLLIDPNYCIIDTKAVYVYQNPDTITSNSLNTIQTYKYGKPHQRNGVKNLTMMQVLGHDSIFNMLEY
jgi:hypothetical protein